MKIFEITIKNNELMKEDFNPHPLLNEKLKKLGKPHIEGFVLTKELYKRKLYGLYESVAKVVFKHGIVYSFIEKEQVSTVETK